MRKLVSLAAIFGIGLTFVQSPAKAERLVFDCEEFIAYVVSSPDGKPFPRQESQSKYKSGIVVIDSGQELAFLNGQSALRLETPNRYVFYGLDDYREFTFSIWKKDLSLSYEFNSGGGYKIGAGSGRCRQLS